MTLKVFIKAILGKIKVVSLKFKKNKEQINVKFSSIFMDPNLKIHFMIDDGMKVMQQILSQ